jgi:hypothetical protein
MISPFDFKRLYTAIFCAAFLLLSAFASADAGRADNVGPYADIEKKWGIRPVAVLLSAGGYMLDFRYHVSDAEKAAPLFSRQIKPYIIEQSSGAKFFVPETAKVGALRQTRKPYPDKNYFIIFGNPAKYVKKGNKVTVVIGDLKIENLAVE